MRKQITSEAWERAYEERFARVWSGPGGMSFGIGMAFAVFCFLIGALAANWELILMSGILGLTSAAALMFAIFIEYGPLRFDPPEVHTAKEQSVNEQVRTGHMHPGKPFLLCGVIVTAIAGVFVIAGAYGAWPLAAGFTGFVLTALGALLEADVAVFRLSLTNDQKERSPRRVRPRTPKPGTSR